MALNDWLSALKEPINAGQSKGDLQRQYNQMRSQIQGGTNAMAEQMKGQLAGRGFRVGESGAADTALGQIFQQGGANLAKAGTDVYLDEARRRMDMANMNMNRLLGAGGLEAQDLASKRNAGVARDISGNQLAWEKEKFGQQFPWEQEQFYMNQAGGLMNSMLQSQQDVYAPYWNAIAGATST
jgi:hypothetical protein